MHKLPKLTLITLAISVMSITAADHPINNDIVDDIKDKTNKWQPYAPEDNPLKDYS